MNETLIVILFFGSIFYFCQITINIFLLSEGDHFKSIKEFWISLIPYVWLPKIIRKPIVAYDNLVNKNKKN